MRPARVSATKMSPFGAVRMMRGPLRPSANNSILKPAGTCGAASAGRATTREAFAAEAVAPGAGRSCGRIRRTVPGLSACQLPIGILALTRRLSAGRAGTDDQDHKR